MSVLYEPFKDEDAISAALDRYWDEARTSLMREWCDIPDEDEPLPSEEQIAERALQIAKEKSRD